MAAHMEKRGGRQPYRKKDGSPHFRGVEGNIPRQKVEKTPMNIEACVSKMNDYVLSEEQTMPFLETCPTILTYEEIERRRDYSGVRDRPYRTVHNGQLKLFLTEVQFLVNYCRDIDEEAYVIYAGSAPGNKNIYLSELFPKIKFIFVDPNEHFFKMGPKNQYTSSEIRNKLLYFSVSDIPAKFNFRDRIKPEYIKIPLYGKGLVDRETHFGYRHSAENIGEIILKDTEHTIFIIEDFYTSALSKDLHTLKNSGKRVFFISDIRTNLRGNIPDEEGEVSPTNADILWNSAQMYNWISILQPDYFMIKFRCPFGYEESMEKILDNEDIQECKRSYGIDFIENYRNKKFIFMKPQHIFLQAYAGLTSAEARLVASYPFDLHSFDIKEYEDRFFYYNNVIRPYGWHSIPEVFLDKYRMIDRCGDCAIMAKIFMDYKAWSYQNKPQPPKDRIEREAFTIAETVLDMLERPRLISNKCTHGTYYDQYENAKAFRLHQDYLCNTTNSFLLSYNIERGERFTPEKGREYLDKIVGSNSFRKNRNICLIQKLFGVKSYPIDIQRKGVQWIQTGNDISLRFPDGSKRDIKVRSLLYPNREDILFSRDIIGEPSPVIQDSYFYKKMEALLQSKNIKNIHIVLSSRCDFLFSDEFYQSHRQRIKIYSLANGSAYPFYSLGNKERWVHEEEDVIIVQIKEDPSVHFYLRKILLEKYKRATLFFLTELDELIYKKNYVKASHGKYIHVEAVNCSETMLTTDVDLDKHIKYFVKNIPYVFRSRLCDECSSDVVDRYGNCERLYLLPDGLLQSFSFLQKIGEHYFLNWQEKPLMCICFSGKNISRDDFFKIRINGNPVMYSIRTLSELYALDKPSMSIQEFYDRARISVDRDVLQWKTTEDAIKSIES